MLLTIAIILLILWALGFFAFHVAGGLIHLLLVIGVIVLIWNFVARPPRRLTAVIERCGAASTPLDAAP